MKRVLVIFLTVVLGVFTALLLARWTGVIQTEYQRKELEKTLKATVEETGPRGLLSLAGVEVNQVLSSEDGVTVLTGNRDLYYSFDEARNIAVYEKVSPSVVLISKPDNSSYGSGIIISPDGYILTCAHVVAQQSEVSVRIDENRAQKAQVVGIDTEDDLAVLKIEAEGLKSITFGSSDLKVGQTVYAIGNPYGYRKALTSGVVSGLDRPVKGKGQVIMNAIQTEAAINPGNSGGALVNGNGELVGICSAKFSEAGGIGFAIPVETAVCVIPDLIKYGEVQRGWIDIAPVTLTPILASFCSLPVENGVLVSRVEPGGEAEKAGLRGGTRQVRYGSVPILLGGDVIVEIDGSPVENLNDYYLALLSSRPGEKVKLKVVRGEKTVSVKVTLVPRKPEDVNNLILW